LLFQKLISYIPFLPLPLLEWKCET